MNNISYKKANLFLKAGLLLFTLGLFSSPSYAWFGWGCSKYRDIVDTYEFVEVNHITNFKYKNKFYELINDRKCTIKLIEEGLDPNIRRIYSRTALMFAIMLQDLEMIDLLLDAGADKNINAYSSRDYNHHIEKTALHYAIFEENIDIVRKLLTVKGIGIDYANHLYRNPFLYAVSIGNIEIINELLLAGADVNFQMNGGTVARFHYRKPGLDEHGSLAFSGVFHSKEELRKKKEIKWGKDKTDKTEFSHVRHIESTSALNTAILNERLDIVKLLLENGAGETINTLRKPNDSTDLMDAVKTGNIEIVNELLEAGADPSLKDIKGNTAVDYAIEYDFPEIADRLRSVKNSAK